MIEYFKLAYRNIKKRALRSWLTILGIIIGVFLVVSLLSLSEGLNNAVMGQLQAVGTDIVMIMPGSGGLDATSFVGGAELKDRHIQAIERTRGVEVVLEMPYTAQTLRFRDRTETNLVTGLDMQDGLDMAINDMGFEIREGEFPRPGRREVLLGHLVPRDTFPDIEPGDQITASGRKFTVAGILKSLGNNQDDNSIIFDLEDYRDVTDTTEGTPVAVARVEEGQDVNRVVANIERSLDEVGKRKRGEDSPSFSVMSSEAMIEMVESILGLIQAGIIAFASIAIIVGAIGIMNTMFTSVRERTKEIGVLKAVGAKKKHIHSIFLVESGMIGLVGGTLGIILGIGFAKLGEIAIAQAGIGLTLEAHFSVNMILITLFFSFLLGCGSGYFPAKKAAKLNPVDALMYE
ncbi:MAG: ABC transporter permease [Patescibacteria group bacterium]